MPPILLFVLRRLAAVPITLLIITATLYAIAMLTPPEARAELYMPNTNANRITPEVRERMIADIVRRYGLDQPYPVQYGSWLRQLLRGQWGYSPSMNEDILPALVRRTPATIEVTLYSVLLFIPLGLISGVIAAWRREGRVDNNFRFAAFVATSIPPFVLGLVLLTIFYAGLRWFPPDRISTPLRFVVNNPEEFRTFTGLLTVDGLLNRRWDVISDAFRHLVLPVFALSLAHWATVGRVMRVSVIEELGKEYIIAARSRGVRTRALLWKHAFRNAMIPALTSSVLSAASLVTGVFVIERIFLINGISEIITESLQTGIGGVGAADVTAALGFAVYSVLIVIPLMTILEIIQAIVDPRIREGITSS